MKESKAYPFLKALLEALIEASPGVVRAPAKFISVLTEQLKNQSKEEVEQLEQEIRSISKGELGTMIKEAGEKVDYRFDKVDEALDEIINLLKLKPEKPLQFPLQPSLHNQTPPEPNFVGRVEMLEAVTNWYKSPEVKIGALIGWGGFGKSALARRWYDRLGENGIKPDGVFWWGFYRNPYLERFLEALLDYLSQGRVDMQEIKTSWQRVEKIKKFIPEGEYLIILDGLEEMQKKKQDEEFGKMQHPEFKEILTGIADSSFKGLCLITTRFPMKDIETYSSYQNCGVEELSKEDTRLLFRKIGVLGSDNEIDAVWEDFKGHTLSLVLLANYLVQNFSGDIKRAKEIPPFPSDKEAGGKAHRILLWYDKQLNENQRQFMKIFSLFRQAVGEKEFDEIFLPMIKKEPFHFKRMVDNLCQRRLISKSSDDTYTTHPLIKGYFESIFDEEEKKTSHKAIYEYFGRIAPDLPETLEEMQPLFEQVYHGTSAGLYEKVYWSIYRTKIHRVKESFLVQKLAAWETDLFLARRFFPEDDLSKMPFVSEKSSQSWLLNEVGLSFLMTGKPKEAEKPLFLSVQMCVEAKDWKNASISYQNLAVLQFRTGELERGFESAKKALEISKNARDDHWIIRGKAYLAWILHLFGKTKEVEEYFREADELERKINGDRLRGLAGIFYADFLISTKRVSEALKLVQTNLKFCQKCNVINILPCCYRCLATIERIKRGYEKAKDYSQKALEITRKIGIPALEIEALLEVGKLHLDVKEYKDAIDTANETLKFITRTGFKFYEPEAELILAKAYLAQGDKSQAKSLAQSAHEKARAMHYKIMENESANLLAGVHVKFVGKR